MRRKGKRKRKGKRQGVWKRQERESGCHPLCRSLCLSCPSTQVQLVLKNSAVIYNRAPQSDRRRFFEKDLIICLVPLLSLFAFLCPFSFPFTFPVLSPSLSTAAVSWSVPDCNMVLKSYLGPYRPKCPE